MLTWTMYAVMVSAGCVGFHVSVGCMPAAMATTIVSPIAREIPKTYAAAIPERAEGIMARSAVWKQVAPMAYEPSRTCKGTARIASSLIELMYGTIMMPMTNPALSMLNPGRSGPDLLQHRRDEEQCEVAIHDRWDRAEQFQKRLHHFTEARARVFAQVDGRHRAERQCDQERDGRGDQRAGDQRQNAVMRIREQRRPLPISEKFP